MDIADRVKQGWLVLNGILHFWNLHHEAIQVIEETQARENAAGAAYNSDEDRHGKDLVFLVESHVFSQSHLRPISSIFTHLSM